MPPGVELRSVPGPGGRSVNPLSVYELAIAALAARISFDWDAPASPWAIERMRVVGLYVRKADKSFANSHVTLGIYYGIVYMSEHKFVPTITQISFLGKVVGSVHLVSLKGLGPSSSETTIEDGTKELIRTPLLGNSSIVADSGQIVDSNDPRVAVEYRHTGRRVNSKDWFQLTMQALIIIACDGTSRSFSHLNAVAESADVTLNIHALHGQHPDPKDVALTMLLLLSIAQTGWFDELEFTLKIGDPDNRTPLAEGFFFRLSRDRMPGDEAATAKLKLSSTSADF